MLGQNYQDTGFSKRIDKQVVRLYIAGPYWLHTQESR